MTKTEAKRRVCHATAVLLDNGSENAWLRDDLSDSDARRMRKAFDELVAELLRRGGQPRK
jgi:hypothetical protein